MNLGLQFILTNDSIILSSQKLNLFDRKDRWKIRAIYLLIPGFV